MTHGEKSALGFLGLITLVIWVSGRIEKHELKSWAKRETAKWEEARHPKELK